MIEDAHRGRINAAVRMLAGTGRLNMTASSLLNRSARRILKERGAELVLRKVRNYIDRAARHARSSGLTDARDYLSEYAASVASLQQNLHQERVRLVFRSLVR
jgi:hypothetical protein